MRVVGGCSCFHDLGACELISRDPFEAWKPQASVEERSQFLSHWKSVVSNLIGNWMLVQIVNYCGPLQGDLQDSRFFFKQRDECSVSTTAPVGIVDSTG